MTLRTVHIADSIGVLGGGAESGYVSFQLVTSATLIRSAIAPHELEDFAQPDSALLDSGGAFAIDVIAPGDLLDAATNAAPVTIYYLITLPSGAQIISTAFVYTAVTQTLSDLNSAAGGVSYATAPVTFPIGRPSQVSSALAPVVITCRLNIDCKVGSQMLLAQDAWTLVVDATGIGTLDLVPNTAITPAGTYWQVSVGGAPPLNISVPADGGDFLDLTIDPLPGGDLTSAVHLTYRGAWVTGVAYAVNDLVSRLGSTYVAIAPNTSDAPPSANWTTFAAAGAGIVWRGVWASGTTYAAGDGVNSGPSSYVAVDASTGSAPPSAHWTVLAQGGSLAGGAITRGLASTLPASAPDGSAFLATDIATLLVYVAPNWSEVPLLALPHPLTDKPVPWPSATAADWLGSAQPPGAWATPGSFSFDTRFGLFVMYTFELGGDDVTINVVLPTSGTGDFHMITRIAVMNDLDRVNIVRIGLSPTATSDDGCWFDIGLSGLDAFIEGASTDVGAWTTEAALGQWMDVWVAVISGVFHARVSADGVTYHDLFSGATTITPAYGTIRIQKAPGHWTTVWFNWTTFGDAPPPGVTVI